MRDELRRLVQIPSLIPHPLLRLVVVVLALSSLACMLAALAWGAASSATGYPENTAGQRAPRALSPEQAALIYVIAHSRTGLPLPERAPNLHFTSRTELRRLYGCDACSVRGLQRGADIFLDQEIDFANALEASILLHEVVHYLQWAARGEVTTCQEWAARERQAYQIQAAEIVRAGGEGAHQLLVSARMLVCK